MPAAAPPPADLPIILPTAEMIEIGDAIYNEGLTKQLLGDKRWRLNNLYWIKPEGGGDPKRFVPRDCQAVIYDHLLETPKIPIYIIKSRRLGFSTAMSVFSGDQAIWEAGQNINLVDLTQPDAFKKMREQIRYSVDSVPRAIHQRIDFTSRNESNLGLRIAGQPDSAISNIYAGMNARGGDSSGLWISEWGPLAAQPEGKIRSAKIVSGAFPAARKGWICTETTWMGGKNGDLWNQIEPIYSGNPNAHGYIYFFPWHGDPYVIKFGVKEILTKYPNLKDGDLECTSVTGEITEDVFDYFRDLEDQIGKRFREDQKRWWAVAKTTYGIKMPQEFPSTLEEALSAPGNAPKYSERGTNFIDKHLKSIKTQYGMINVRNDRAQWEDLGERDSSAWARVWEHPVAGRTYVISIDWCTGQKTVTEDPDFHAVCVLRASYQDERGVIHPAAVVAAIKTKVRTELDILCKQIRAFQLYYGDCLVVPEINNMHGVIALLQQANVTNIYERQLFPDSKEDKRLRTELGWNTTKSSKPLICDNLGTIIREECLLLYCPHILSELRAFQTNLLALTGHHDDWVISLAIGMHALPLASPMVYAPPVVARAASDHYPDQAYADNAQHFYATENLRDSILG